MNQLGKTLARRLPSCRTKQALLPGAYRISAARALLESTASLSRDGVERLLAIYGGRAAAIVSKAGEDSDLLRCIDTEGTVLAAEVSFAVNEEFARTLTDIVFRRLMLGLRADQGRILYEEVSTLAAAACNWDDQRRNKELDALRAFSESFRV